ncbi:hypothetical protein ACVIU4_010991 [Bradyrhizobium barranii subsp. barranii]|nr:hypothetical protein [Bradyrhizobium japonicum]MCP1954961.1 hypothetical protein [Bradyrhizobium japonicum]
MAGWMVTVGVVRDDGKIGHEMYVSAYFTAQATRAAGRGVA